jgi:myo-inositol 2-dehydrogenase/D-chiro-inositol 1-dehydrogenase
MTVRVGVIGVGNIGQDHISRLSRRTAGVQVVAVSDVDRTRAERAATDLVDVRVFGAGEDLIRDGSVDAVVVTTSGVTHQPYVLAAIEQGKPVFCEKPLAPTTDACLRILDAEVAGGRRLVQVGFMRRYDDGYRAMKAAIDGGTLGAPLMIHCAHRNASTPATGFTSEMLITDAAIHEIDLVRWLLGQEIAAAVAVLTPGRSSRDAADLLDPQIVILEMAGGATVDVEVFVNCGYGYDIQCQVVGESGAVSLGDGGDAIVRRSGQYAGRVPADWKERFVQAYDVELQDWVDSVAVGITRVPSAWDGYAATAVSNACLETLRTGRRTPVQLRERPALYEEPA